PRPGAACSDVRLSLGERDYSVVPALATVDDARLLTLGVDEQEEIVADELHLVDGLLDRKAFSWELLRANHDRAVRGLRLANDRHRARSHGVDHLGGRGLQVDAREVVCRRISERGAAAA